MLKGIKVYIRTVEPSDATKLLLWENNVTNWRVSDTEVPFSMYDIKNYIENQHNIRSTGQLRFIICKTESDEPVGAIDLYDANFKHGRAGVGILIGEIDDRSNGYATESLNLLKEYAEIVLGLHALYCSIHADNESSIRLFEKCEFEKIGIRKEWYLEKGKRIDEILYQLCLKK
ncbi:MAG: GNAT family N-acetyltransferase [Flavobacteriia bacterium]|nr:GNAT family N-acetyltransferase [Flavobacteriia bacterium]